MLRTDKIIQKFNKNFLHILLETFCPQFSSVSISSTASDLPTKGNCKNLCIKTMINLHYLFLSCRSWLGMWKKWKQTKNPLFWFGWGKYSQNPEQSVDNLKHPKDNEIVRLNILGESFLRGRKLHSTNNRSLLIYMYISISLLS